MTLKNDWQDKAPGVPQSDYRYRAADQNAVADAVNNTARVVVTPESKGAAGNGTANDSTAFAAALATTHAVVLSGSYRLDQLSVTNDELRGEHYNVLRSVDTDPILVLRAGSVLDNVTIDGENSTSRRVDIGATAAADSNISIRNTIIKGCPINGVRVIGDTTDVRMIGVYADASKIFNTDDDSTAQRLMVLGVISKNSAGETFILDFPAVDTPNWTGFLVSQGIWQSSAATKRLIGFARARGGLVTGHVLRGALSTADPTFSHLLWAEDRAEFIAFTGNVMETNGSARAVAGSAGSENAYGWTDYNPKELLYTGNLYKASTAQTTELIYLAGTGGKGFETTTVVNETLHCNSVAKPAWIVAKSGVYGRCNIYDAPSPIRIQPTDEATNNSHLAANIVKLPSHHVKPHFFRGVQGHGFNPDGVIFRTSFQIDTFANFQTWLNTVKTITGATISTFGGSLGTGGTITLPVDTATGATYLRATRGTTAMTSRLDLIWNVKDIDFQNLDSFCVRLLTKSSIQNAGKLTMEMPSSGMATYTQILNDGTDYASWKADGGSKMAATTANFLAAGAGTIKCSVYFGDGLATNGDTCDFGSLAVSINRATPF
jgi:hypothetical protein